MPVSVVADKLTDHLLREITIRGSQGGPLLPLADQLNHDLTHLQGQRIEGQGQRIEACSVRSWTAGSRPGLAGRRCGAGGVATGRRA